MRLVETADGSFTLLSDRYNESYHSVKEGALRETLEKHVRPAFTYATIGESVRILDICFGLGYNSLCAIAVFGGKIEIIAPEMDRELIASLPNLPYPKMFDRLRPVIQKLSDDLYYEDERVSVKIALGDAAKLTQTMPGEFDVIFQDPFSYNKNPELWSARFFTDLYRLLKPTGVLTTYSASHKARTAMANVGFLLHTHPFTPNGGLRKGTIASKRALELPSV
ncbi:MAG: hypothetical protein LBI57_05510 [Helicobacteraceae bacterium]|jgi:tRNA U34 5-methylaminomethyl-2-thiouridine-forming methyltransferase MnmC|nr:hypothetical protein [Helicobacteraceae bacterium]